MSKSITVIDVGAHEGQTLEELVKPIYNFKEIIAFEPMPKQFDILSSKFGHCSNVRLLNYGLSNVESTMPIFGNNESMEASTYSSKIDLNDPSCITMCNFLNASNFIDSIEGLIIMKLNCEGSEVQILNDLLDTGSIFKISNIMIDFDIKKVPEESHNQSIILERFKEVGYTDYFLCEEVMIGSTHQDRIANWLSRLNYLWA